MGKTILAVDDSPSIRQMVSFTLNSVGYEVIEAVDGPIEASSPMGDEVPPHTQERITGVLEHVTQQSREYLAGITFASLLKDNGSPVG